MKRPLTEVEKQLINISLMFADCVKRTTMDRLTNEMKMADNVSVIADELRAILDRNEVEWNDSGSD